VVAATPTVQQPLEEIIEILALAYEGGNQGAGGLSHVLVQYRDGASVQPPLWYLRENNPNFASGGVAGPGDAVAVPAGPVPGNGRRRGPGGTAPRPQTPMPTSTAGQQILQTLWAAGDGSPRFEARLWPPYEHIRLVRVASDARVAFFVRDPQPVEGGAPPPPPVEEPLYKSTLNLSQEVLKTIDEVLSKEAAERVRLAQAAAAGDTTASSGTAWVDVAETTKIENVYHVARKENPDQLIERVNADSYVSRTGSGLRGVRIMNVEPALAARFGVVQGDVILAVNGEPVRTKAEAINVGRRQYERGQRTFVVRFLSNGQEIERTYQAPDR
jgi:hypothetical protein